MSGWVVERVSVLGESVRDVCMSNQSDRIYYKQPIKFLALLQIHSYSCNIIFFTL